MRRIPLYAAAASAAVLAASLVLALQYDAGAPMSAAGGDRPLAPLHAAADVDSPEIPGQMAAASNTFALDFHRQVYPEAEEDAKNVFFSPLSMYTAFSILYEGARGETAEQLRGVFGFEPDASSRHNMTSYMIADINADDEHAVLELANSLWLKKDFIAHDSYVDIVRDTYLADIERVDFLGDGVERINAWAGEKTHGKITEVLTSNDVNDLTRAAILNAIYFKGTWLTQFAEEDTRSSAFHSGGREIDAEFMSMTAGAEYADHGDFKLLKLPYKGERLSMVLALPSERDGLGRLQEGLAAGTIQEWRQSLETHDEVIIKVPKFETRTSYNLIEYLKNLGVVDVFNNRDSNLTGIADTHPLNLFVKTAVHDAYVQVNEEGTEAAAVTTILIEALEEPPPPPAFIADRPFMFFIMDDESGTILFMGSILDPTE